MLQRERNKTIREIHVLNNTNTIIKINVELQSKSNGLYLLAK